MTDVAHEQEAAARQRQGATRGFREDAIGVQRPHHLLPALREGRLQRALHEAQPVPINAHLVGGVDRGDRVLTVLNRGDGGLDDDVRDTGGIRFTDGVTAVEPDLDVQSVMLEQNGSRRGRVAKVSDESTRVRESGRGSPPPARPGGRP